MSAQAAPLAVDEARRAAVRVLVVHNSELVLVGSRTLLARQPWVSRALVAPTLDRAVALAHRYEPHVALAHVGALGVAGTVCARLHEARPLLPILLMTETGRMTRRDAVMAGALGVVDTAAPAEQLLDAVHAAASGEAIDEVVPADDDAVGLSARELQVLAYLSTGARNSDIGRALLLSPETIKHHVRSAYRKLGVHSRLEAVMRAQQLGLLG